jgi:hypothetical protein
LDAHTFPNGSKSFTVQTFIDVGARKIEVAHYADNRQRRPELVIAAPVGKGLDLILNRSDIVSADLDGVPLLILPTLSGRTELKSRRRLRGGYQVVRIYGASSGAFALVVNGIKGACARSTLALLPPASPR